jgi:CheY-like chemotaxis protein
MTSWLLVEDEADLFEMLLGMFDLFGLEGAAFSTGEEALEWIDKVDQGLFPIDELPELALLDIRLPGLATGVDVGARIRESPMMGHIAVVMMTAYRLSPAQEYEITRQAGADLLLYKPLPDFGLLQRKLTDLANSKRV